MNAPVISTTMISPRELMDSLEGSVGPTLAIEDLSAYADKVSRLANCLALRSPVTGELLAYLLYYDDQPRAFVTMLWTHPDHRRKGYARTLMRRLIHASGKDIVGRVRGDNPAGRLNASLGFKESGSAGDSRAFEYLRRIAIMQPYFFPYIGYFHLIEASSLMIFYDDVQYMRRGWVNRNRILLNHEPYMFTIPVSRARRGTSIAEVRTAMDTASLRKFRNRLASAYRQAPHYSEVADLVMSVLNSGIETVADLAIHSIVAVYDYLGMDINYVRSSEFSPESRALKGADRLIEMVKKAGCSRYVNATGGTDLYSREYFQSRGVELSFLCSDMRAYDQLSEPFVPGLSIIDVLMFNDIPTVRSLLTDYSLT